MNILKTFIFGCFFVFCATSYGQTSTAKLSDVENPTYDAELAKKVGADDIGMKTYVFVILKTGTTKISDAKEREKIQAGHMANIGRLAKERKLVLAGPFFDDQSPRGIFIFDVRTIEEAKKLVETDPAVKAGTLAPEMRLWFGSAALSALPEIHEKITKKKL